VIVFHTLRLDHIKQIVDLQVGAVGRWLAERGIRLGTSSCLSTLTIRAHRTQGAKRNHGW
jgi:ATP-dependent Clp protease ATP-binding subunit ClpA